MSSKTTETPTLPNQNLSSATASSHPLSPTSISDLDYASPPPLFMDSTILDSKPISAPIDCIICLSTLPHDSVPDTDEFQAIARVVPCEHLMHDPCLKLWTERANTCPICRVSFNEVALLPFVTGPVLSTYKVEDKTQRVAYEGTGADALGPDVAPTPASFAAVRFTHSHPALQSQLQRRRRLLYDRIRAPRSAAPSELDWYLAWQSLDADLNLSHSPYPDHSFSDPDDADFDSTELGIIHPSESLNHRLDRYRNHELRMTRRRGVAAAQAAPGENGFERSENAWAIQNARPREVFPHLQRRMTREEEESWRMMEEAERIEREGERLNKRRRRDGDGEEEVFHASDHEEQDSNSPPTTSDARKFKRPRTKRDSALPRRDSGNTNSNPEPGPSAEAPAPEPAPPLPDTPSGGIFTSLLANITKPKPEIPIVSTLDLDLHHVDPRRPNPSSRNPSQQTIMRPLSPADSASGRSRSPQSPGSRPTSPPIVPVRGRLMFEGPRTPAVSPERMGSPPRVRAWEMASPAGSPRSGSPTGIEGGGVGGGPRMGEEQKEIVDVVKAELKKYYPGRLGKEAFTEVCGKICKGLFRDGKGVEEVKEVVGGVVEREVLRREESSV